MLTEVFASNLASTVVIHGGMDAPEAGTIQTLTVKEPSGIFPEVRGGLEQFHFKDRNPERGEELFRCIGTEGDHWVVERGAENTRPVPHAMKFGIRQVTTAEFYQRLGAGSTTELVNAVTVFGADPTGRDTSETKLTSALASGPVYLSSGVYSIRSPLNLLAGQTLMTFGRVLIRPTADFEGDAAIEIVDGNGVTRVEGIELDGSDLGAGRDIYGIYAETRKVEAELRNIRISRFPNSGIIGSGIGWMLDRILCSRNFGSGVEMNFTEALWLGCRAIDNYRYGFIGKWGGDPIGCIARGNKLGDIKLP